MRLPFLRRGQVADPPPQVEERASYTDELVAQAFANATEPAPSAGALAVVEKLH